MSRLRDRSRRSFASEFRFKEQTADRGASGMPKLIDATA